MENGGGVPEDYCGPCYGANPNGETNPCCNTCEEVQKAYATMGWGNNPDQFEQVNTQNFNSTLCSYSFSLVCSRGMEGKASSSS